MAAAVISPLCLNHLLTIKKYRIMAIAFWIIVAILVVCNWTWFEERVRDIESIGGIICTIALVSFWTWALHGVAAWVGFFDSWLLSFAIVCIYAVGRHKYAG